MLACLEVRICTALEEFLESHSEAESSLLVLRLLQLLNGEKPNWG